MSWAEVVGNSVSQLQMTERLNVTVPINSETRFFRLSAP
jgi:hypothetical protein